MTDYRCRACALTFAAEEARCPQCLRKTTVEPSAGAERRSPAHGHLTASWILLALATALHAASLASVAINLALFLAGSAPAHGPERAGELGTFVVIGLYSLFAMFWAPATAFGLYQRRAWARRSAIAYWAVALATCCGLPFGAYGLYAMLRADVRALFDDQATKSNGGAPYG